MPHERKVDYTRPGHILYVSPDGKKFKYIGFAGDIHHHTFVEGRMRSYSEDGPSSIFASGSIYYHKNGKLIKYVNPRGTETHNDPLN